MKSKFLLILMAGCLLSMNLSAQCRVYINAQQNPNSTDVTFYADSITGGGFWSSFSWSFGDGTGGSGTQTSHHYTLNGASTVFTVCLTMNDTATNCTYTTCDTIRVSTTTAINCTTVESYTNVDTIYTFTTTNSGTPPFIYSWTSNGQLVGSGSTLTLPLSDSAGAGFDVCVTVTDWSGCVSGDCSYITIQHACNTYTSYTHQDSTYTFTASHLGGAPAHYNWTYGNNFLDSSASVTLVLGTAALANGATICVTITDSNGCSSSDCSTVSSPIIGGGCQAYFVIYPDTTNSPAGSYIGYNSSSGGYGSNVLWSFGDGSTTTNPFPTHQYAQPGQYIICLTVGVAGTTCYDTYCDSSFYAFKTDGGLMSSLTILAPTGINDLTGSAGLQVYPNPTNNELTIATDKKIDQLKVYNIDGQLVLERKTSVNKIDVSKLNAGIYVLELSAEGQVSRTKFVKD